MVYGYFYYNPLANIMLNLVKPKIAAKFIPLSFSNNYSFISFHFPRLKTAMQIQAKIASEMPMAKYTPFGPN